MAITRGTGKRQQDEASTAKKKPKEKAKANIMPKEKQKLAKEAEGSIDDEIVVEEMTITRGTGKRQQDDEASTAKQKPEEKAKANLMRKEKQKMTKEAEGSIDDQVVVEDMAIIRGTRKRKQDEASTAKKKLKEKAKVNFMPKNKQKIRNEAEGSLDDDDEVEIVAEHFAIRRGRGTGKRKQEETSTANKKPKEKAKNNVAPRKKQKMRKEAEGSIETSFLFLTRQRARTYKEKFEKKDILKGRSLKLDDFMDFPFGMWLKLYGLKIFVSVEEIIYPQLVKMFYCNITDGDNCNDADPNMFIKTYVKGVEIPLSPAMLHEVFGMVYDPDMHTVKVTKEETYPILSKNQCVGKDLKKMPSKYLRTMNMRLFHYMIVYNLFPRAGSYTTVTGGNAVLLFAQAQGEDFNFPIRLIIHMLRCRYRKRMPLLYGMAITKILKHYGVDVSGEEEIKYKKADTIDINVMSRLGYVFNEGENAWVEKQVTQEFSRDDDSNKEDGENDDRGEDENGDGRHKRGEDSNRADGEHDDRGEDEAGEGKHKRGEDNAEHQVPTLEGQYQGSQHETWNELKKSLMDHVSQCFFNYQTLMSLPSPHQHLPPSSIQFDMMATPSTIPTTTPMSTTIKQVTPSSPTFMPTPTEEVAPNSPTSMPKPTEEVAPNSPTSMPIPTKQVAPNSPTSMPMPTELVTPYTIGPRSFTPFSGFSHANSNVSSFAFSGLLDSMEKLKSTMEHFITWIDTRMDGFERQLSHLQTTLESRNGGTSTSKGGDS